MLFSASVLKMYKSQLFARYDENGTVFYFSSDDFKGLNKEPYAFKTESGNRLQGYFYFYENPVSDRLIIFDHGMGGGHRAYMREIDTLAKHGYLVFSYDHTGCMESDGGSANGFLQSIHDLNCALNALKSEKRFANIRFSVVGHSWGALSCQNISEFHPDVAHIVGISGPVSAKRIIDQNFKGPLKFYRNEIYGLEKSANPKYFECDASRSLRNTSAQVLIIHSSDDKIVLKPYHFDVLYSALSERENVRFLLVDGKGHNPNYTADAVKYKDEFFAILTRKIKKGELSSDSAKSEFLSRFDWYRMTEQDEAVWSEIFKTLDNL